MLGHGEMKAGGLWDEQGHGDNGWGSALGSGAATAAVMRMIDEGVSARSRRCRNISPERGGRGTGAGKEAGAGVKRQRQASCWCCCLTMYTCNRSTKPTRVAASHGGIPVSFPGTGSIDKICVLVRDEPLILPATS